MVDVIKKQPRRSGRRVVKGIIFLLICGAILGAVVFLPIFTLKEIKLTGATYLTVDDILKVGDIYIGEPLFKLETDKVAGRLLNDVRVEDVTVRRALPHTLEVNITERKAIATVVCNYGYLDIDKHGKILDSYKNLREMSIPMITGALVKDLYIGDDVEDEHVQKILEFLDMLDAASLNKISEVAIVAENYVVAYTDTERAVQIRIGALERLEEKAKLTEDFLRDLDKNPNAVEYVDFNYTAPFIKLYQ